MSDQFPGHVAGTPYELTREHFARFVAMDQAIGVIQAAMAADAHARYQAAPGPEGAFWAAIAAFEAGRRFDPLAGCCHSDLVMDTDDGAMAWRYWSTSGTLMEAFEPRYYSTAECGELPPPIFRVTIPAERDQPGRYHWEQLRNGGTYCD